jgi:hypothetical protein
MFFIPLLFRYDAKMFRTPHSKEYLQREYFPEGSRNGVSKKIPFTVKDESQKTSSPSSSGRGAEAGSL